MSPTAKSPDQSKRSAAVGSPGCALVTGGAGFIRGRLVERLVADGWQVNVKRVERLWRAQGLQVPAPGQSASARQEWIRKSDLVGWIFGTLCGAGLLFVGRASDLCGIDARRRFRRCLWPFPVFPERHKRAWPCGCANPEQPGDCR